MYALVGLFVCIGRSLLYALVGLLQVLRDVSGWCLKEDKIGKNIHASNIGAD